MAFIIGCKHAADDEPLPPMTTIKGKVALGGVANITRAMNHAYPPRVSVSWHVTPPRRSF